ncbi:MAG: bifunctional DNA-formamidopyrimidine glycosylase/DNA-(apurinic or apyrimidinic site) lyase [Bryobacteraceae bacterium]|nr:bifunctional DNA-formamidopyrimidine glycosylase/DNA-(apurinic or apyrimidinic site) lyase [Bryobacteraceae bacterium]
MPELPEAEYMVRRLRESGTGTISQVKVLRPGMTGDQPARRLPRLAAGQAITGYGRRAKSVLIQLANAHTIRIRLGMSGHVYRVADAAALPKHTRLAFLLREGGALAFEDARTFGDVTIHADADLPQVFADLGPEPLDASFTPAVLAQALAGSRAPVKPLLLDQSRVVGLGNIWAAEALWQARISPTAPAGALNPKQIRALHKAVVGVLTQAVANTFRATETAADFPEADLLAVAVYQREGQPCRRCRKSIERFVQAGRSTFYCPVCQSGTAIVKGI